MIAELTAATRADVAEALDDLDVLVTEDSADAISALAAGQTVVLVPPPSIVPTTFKMWQATFELWALATTIDPHESTRTLSPVLEAIVPLGVTEANPDQFETRSQAFAGYRITITNTYSKE